MLFPVIACSNSNFAIHVQWNSVTTINLQSVRPEIDEIEYIKRVYISTNRSATLHFAQKNKSLWREPSLQRNHYVEEDERTMTRLAINPNYDQISRWKSSVILILYHFVTWSVQTVSKRTLLTQKRFWERHAKDIRLNISVKWWKSCFLTRKNAKICF